ncbi:MAG: hypothetical protein ACHQT9_02270 [Candidatus Saccharimonadales bacterium]
MLATVGFIVTGICFFVFAFTFHQIIVDKVHLKVDSFVYAYYALGLAFITWGIAAAINKQVSLNHSIIIGDALLIIGTLFMFNVLLTKKYRFFIYPAIVLGAYLLYLRAAIYTPIPYMKGGLLIFNSQFSVALILGILFIGIWLPGSVKVTFAITKKIHQDSIRNMYAYMYCTATFATLIFIAARRVLTVVISFIAMGVCFAMLIGSNLLMGKLVEEKHARAK